MALCRSCGVGRVTRNVWCENCDPGPERDAEFARALLPNRTGGTNVDYNVTSEAVPDSPDAEDTLWAIRILGEFIQDEIDNRSSVGDDQAEYRAAPREAYAAFMLLKAAALRNEIRDAQRQSPDQLNPIPA